MGILIFLLPGHKGYSGHATLWDGSNCYDSCYFGDEASKAYFWELKWL